MQKKPTKPKPNSKLITLIMTPLLFLSLLLFSFSSATHHRHVVPPTHDSIPPDIHHACTATRFPNSCESSLKELPPNPNPTHIIVSAISSSSKNLKTAQTMVETILDSSQDNLNRSTAAKTCLEVLNNSGHRLGMASEAVPRGRTKDARAWTSAALLFQYDCWSNLKYVNATALVGQTMSFMNNTMIVWTSNALSMLAAYDRFGEDVGKWRTPQTERDGFWEDSSAGLGSGYRGGIFQGLKTDVTVCKGQGCNFTTVQGAVDAAPEDLPFGKRFVIGIKEGVYEETIRVGLNKRNLVFLGDGMGLTVITGSLYSGQPGVTTYNSATVGVLGDGFMASGLTIKNTAGPDAHQAVALRSDSDQSIFENCEFISNQDTLYAHSLRQFYKSCRISGNVDFIFGNSASLFEDCLILVRPRQIMPGKGENDAVTAHGRTDPAQSTGFVFLNCIVNGTDEYMALYNKNPKAHKNYLGRPWKEYSRTVFIQSKLEALIAPQGWMPWSGDFALKTLYYGEFGNIGPGSVSNVSGRVAWSSQIPAEHIGTYSVQNFIQGGDWIPTSS